MKNSSKTKADLLKEIEKKSKTNRKLEHEKEIYQQKLIELQITLKNIIPQIENQKVSLKETIALNIEKNIQPLIDKLKRQKIYDEKTVISIETNLSSMTSDFYRKMINYKFQLTPTEMKVTQMIKSGYLLKEIAEMNHVSITTIKTHVNKIRKKLGLLKRSDNLRSFLNQIA